MFLNLLHRPLGGARKKLFEYQQKVAHDLNLKVTIMLQYSSMNDQELVELARYYEEKNGDELGVWFNELYCDEYDKEVGGREPMIWLYSTEDKEKIIQLVLNKYRELFKREPVSVGAYHLDAVSLKIIKRECPSVKIAVAGCFEEGVKVFHGCNNSWYLFNEGMPWGPWYPSDKNSLIPAENDEEAIDIVAVPHLSRDMALSYEGRNDFFASHPANVQRAMANEGSVSPYNLNLVDQYRLQEDYNHGFSFYHVFVGSNWLSGNKNIHDSDEITQGLYKELLGYFVELRSQGKLQDLHMSEFASWYKQNIPIGSSQVFLAKDILYGSGKHYFWYIDPSMRVLVDTAQGGSIGDFRPFVGKLERHTGTDSPCKQIGSNPYIIHSQYRTGMFHHHSDGSRTTMLLKHGDEVIDLGTCQTRCEKVEKNENQTCITLTPAKIQFKDGLTAQIETTFKFEREGKIEIIRKLVELSDSSAELKAVEYFKGCYGATEYPENMEGISLNVIGEENKTIEYQYKSRTITTSNAKSASAKIPQLNTEVLLEREDFKGVNATAVEGYLFNPYFTLTLESDLRTGKELRTCLRIQKIN